jgi:hypothetical protein
MNQGILRNLLRHARSVGFSARLLLAATFIGMAMLGMGATLTQRQPSRLSAWQW